MPTFSPSSGPPGSTSPSLEQYVEAIADLLTRDKVCSISEIAEQVQVSRPAASRAVRELKDMELVEHKAYGYVDLTPKGQSLAEKLAARHQALYDFFAKVLEFEDGLADQEACRLEHHIDDDFVGRMRELTAFFVTEKDAAARWSAHLKKYLKKHEA